MVAIGTIGWVGYRLLKAHLLAELRREVGPPTPSVGAIPPATSVAHQSPTPTQAGATIVDLQARLKADSLVSLTPADQQAARSLAELLAKAGQIDSVNIVQTEDLFRRYPNEPILAQLLRSALLTAAAQHHSKGDLAQARAVLEHTVALFPKDAETRRACVIVVAEMRDWPATETLARRILEDEPTSPDARQALALSLAGQGNDREALRAIYSALEVVNDSLREPQLRELRDQIERRLWATSGCELSKLQDPPREGDANQRVEKFLVILSSCSGGSIGQKGSHFSVAFKRVGDDVVYERLRARIASVDGVARDMLPILERHYSTLAVALDHQVMHTVPVVILTDVEYRVSTGAPEWSGGQFDHDDGTITVPLSLFDRVEFDEPEQQRKWEEAKGSWLERVLLHETAHVFIEDISGGTAPREIHEGLAKYLEREVTRDRASLSDKIATAAETRARGATRDEQEFERLRSRLLSSSLEEIRTAGLGHAGTLLSLYTGGELFIEYLVDQRGMGGIQELLKAMGASKSVDTAFEQVYGQGFDGTRRAWLDRLRQKWGGAPRQ